MNFYVCGDLSPMLSGLVSFWEDENIGASPVC